MSLGPRLSRYKKLAWFIAKYARADFVTHAGLEPLPESDRATTPEAEAFVRDLESLGPTFIKIGQLLSTRADLLPQPYLDALARLQDNVPPFPFEDVERIIETELGARLSKAFASFDSEPIAAASLGQVHHAVLRSGHEVAVKVQRPGVREQVIDDLDALEELASLWNRFGGSSRNIDAVRVLQEFRRSLMSELDYREEARNLVTLARQLCDFERIIVPLPVDDYSTARVLTMDYVPGTKITAVSPVERTEVDGAALADDLFRAYLQQILVDGVFHADPHPGNVLLTPDHRLALVDLGMVGHLSATVQEQLFRLMLAISERRGDEAADVAIALGEQREEFDEAPLRRAIVEIGRVLDPTFDVNASMRRNATSLMRRRMLKSAAPSNLFASVLEVRDFVERLPVRVNRILDSLASNDLRLKVEVIDHGSIIEGLQKVANRITLGLVLAALIVGAALLMRVQTTFTILGYPGLAILLFLTAAGGGFWLAMTILFWDRRNRIP